jgi:hypothetical protein
LPVNKVITGGMIILSNVVRNRRPDLILEIMTQLLQNLYIAAPYFFVLVLIGATIGGLWLALQMKKSHTSERFSVSDQLFLKRNASRLRKVQLH